MAKKQDDEQTTEAVAVDQYDDTAEDEILDIYDTAGAPYPLVPVHPDVIRTMNEEITFVLVSVTDAEGDVLREIVHINTPDGLNLAVIDPIFGENDEAAVDYISALFDLND